jgi:putative transposase
MANTFSCLNIHYVFSTKERVSVLDPDIRERLWPYVGGIAKENGMIPKCIGGVSDYVHLRAGVRTDPVIGGTVHYIEQQLEHHRTRSFQEKFLVFLKKHGAHFNEKYLWD